MTDDDEDAEIISLTHDAVMTYLINITPKSYSFSIIPCALFPTRWLKMMDMTSSLSDLGKISELE
jgi:hypothetical protein